MATPFFGFVAVYRIGHATPAAVIARGRLLAEKIVAHHRGVSFYKGGFSLQGNVLATREYDGRKEVYAPQGRVLAARECYSSQWRLLVARQSSYRNEACSPPGNLRTTRKCARCKRGVIIVREGDRRKGVLLITIEAGHSWKTPIR
ncbi:hypothetical protein D8674_028949 [Pyrus ussuriensis x Pyrus communis]|uniref:Uncharacterized protein n=1 Tax=Pyrus ussuriensis x Pyrus communis TaxID=2448454 RepID=A0A5N5I2R4_9ROSA|nr:hypothetical protein D8674_028949 [Pyrus ussuriensis x Pyrus communis]